MGKHLKLNRPCRIDDEIYLKIKYLAKLENRSFNNYIENLFIKTINEYESINGTISVNTDDLYD